jgi:hypothetical protein
MMEMRWLKRPIGNKLSGTKIVTVYERVLQYRQMEDKTVYAQANALSQDFIARGHRNMQWSAWSDIREVVEE